MHFLVIGWGLTSAEDNGLSRILQEVNLTVWENSRCHSVWSPMGFPISDGQICASNLENTACLADSGGPAMVLVNHYVNFLIDPALTNAFTTMSLYIQYSY